jgi:molybdate transport system substrate-binding protein
MFLKWLRSMLLTACLAGGSAHAAEIKVMSALAMQAVMLELGPRFERETGHQLNLSFGTVGAVVKRLKDGEKADLVLIPKAGIEQLKAAGFLSDAAPSLLARSGIGMALRKGAPKLDISTVDKLKKALLEARSVTYSAPVHGGATGLHIEKTFESLGIRQAMKEKTVFLPAAGLVAKLVASGEVEIAIQQVQELIQVDGVDLVGPWPAEVQDTIVFFGARLAGSSVNGPAQALTDFLLSPGSALVFKAKGMETAH